MASTNFPVDILQNHRYNQETLQKVSLLFWNRETQNVMPFSRDKGMGRWRRTPRIITTEGDVAGEVCRAIRETLNSRLNQY